MYFDATELTENRLHQATNKSFWYFCARKWLLSIRFKPKAESSSFMSLFTSLRSTTFSLPILLAYSDSTGSDTLCDVHIDIQLLCFFFNFNFTFTFFNIKVRTTRTTNKFVFFLLNILLFSFVDYSFSDFRHWLITRMVVFTERIAAHTKFFSHDYSFNTNEKNEI